MKNIKKAQKAWQSMSSSLDSHSKSLPNILREKIPWRPCIYWGPGLNCIILITNKSATAQTIIW